MRQVSHIILQPQTRCILRIREVERRTGYKRSHIYHLMKESRFPRHFKIGVRAVGWDSEDIDQWINSQLKKSPLKGTEKV